MENFEFLKKYDEGVYNEIIKAEEKAKTEPTLAAFQTRKALEALVKYICTQQKINVTGSNNNEQPSLDNYIFSIKNKKIFEYKTCDKIYKIKDRGNKVTHYQENRPDLVSEDEIELLSYLHEIICEYLKKYKSVYIRQKFNKDHIHIGKLEVTTTKRIRNKNEQINTI